MYVCVSYASHARSTLVVAQSLLLNGLLFDAELRRAEQAGAVAAAVVAAGLCKTLCIVFCLVIAVKLSKGFQLLPGR